jgi:uncharacterized protein (TIGR02271 family)
MMFGRGPLFSLFGLRRIDPKLDQWARRAFAELKQMPLFQPTHDLSKAVVERIKKLEEARSEFRDQSVWDWPRRGTTVAAQAFGGRISQEVQMQNRFYGQIHEGMDVLDTDGQKIGKAGETLGEYFNVDAGLFGAKEYYIPFSAVTDVADDSIFLNVRKDQIDSMGWDQRPEMAGTSTSGTTARAEPERTVQLREEELQARKSPVETGRVELGKEVVEQQRTMDVPVTREEVYVERRPVERRPSDQPIGTEGESIRVPVREEQVEVEKQPVVYEEVGVGKRVTQDTQKVSDTVRREELRTDKEGEPELREKPNPNP